MFFDDVQKGMCSVAYPVKFDLILATLEVEKKAWKKSSGLERLQSPCIAIKVWFLFNTCMIMHETNTKNYSEFTKIIKTGSQVLWYH